MGVGGNAYKHESDLSQMDFQNQLNPDGSMSKLKARLVVKGCAQVSGVNISELLHLLQRWN